MSYKRVAVLRGGPSAEYDVSMKSGAAVLAALNRLGYNFKDIVITKRGEWLDAGIVRSPKDALEAVDVVFIALHGAYGEDGQLQKLLQRLYIPFTGSRALPSATAFNKYFTKRALKAAGITMAKHHKVDRSAFSRMDAVVDWLTSELGEELFIKPVTGGSSHGAEYVPNREVLKATLEALLTAHEELLVEEFIRGREATVGVLEQYRNEQHYVLPVVEIVPPNGSPLFTTEDKYNGRTEEIVPGRFSYHEKSKLADVARLVHTHLGCDQYSRSDFIVRGGDVYFLEVNTLPGLTDQSLFPKAAAAVGLEFHELIRHFIETAKV